MECFWRLFGHWKPHGHCHQQDQAVFYVRFITHHGFPHYHLYGAGFLEKYAELYPGSKEKSLVLFVEAVST